MADSTSTIPHVGNDTDDGRSMGIGIIIPPPTRKTIIDKTAAFVAKNGRHVEEEILSRPQGQNAANFTFLLEDDPFHAYYLSKVAEFQAGVPPPQGPAQVASAPAPQAVPAAEQPVPPTNKLAAAPALRASSLVEALRASSKKKGQTPPPFEFSLESPPDATRRDTAKMKLTAQFAAMDGKKFEMDLFHKEKQNMDEFGFLHANHPHHSYYTELVRCYKKLLEGNIGWLADLGKSEMVLLERAVHRFEFRRDEAMKRMETDEKRASERLAYLEIDWHDFVIVETIRFDEDETIETRADGGLGIDALVSEAADAARKAVAVEDSDEIGEIRKDFSVQPVRATMSVPMVVLDNGQQVPVTEMNATQHVNRLDPKWREYQERFEAKQRVTNFAEGGSMPMHLARLAGARPDVFGGEREEAERRWEERKRKKEAEVVAWDGNLLSADTVKAAAVSLAAAALQPVPSIFATGSHSSASTSSTFARPPLMPPIPPAAPSAFPLPPPLPPSLTTAAVRQAAAPVQELGGKRAKVDESVNSLVVLVPAGGPSGLGPTELTLSGTGSATVNEFKELISSSLSNVAVSKFQLKIGEKFLKNTDQMETIPVGSTIELKWKSR